MESLVSIILPCYNMGKFIAEALEGIAKQTHANWEVIAVDDRGPEDGTREWVEAFAARHPQQRIELLVLSENRGVSGARNAGAAVARGSYLAFLDPDDFWTPDHLEIHLAAHHHADEPIVTTSRAHSFVDGAPAKSSGEWGFTAWEKANFPRSLAMRNVIIPSTVLLPASQFHKVGGFDEDRAMQHTEDWDLWVRLVDLGIVFRFLDPFTVHYRRHQGGATANRTAMRRRVQAFSQKHHANLFADLGICASQLAHRVDALESRLNWLQSNPAIRCLSGIQRLLNRGGTRKSNS